VVTKYFYEEDLRENREEKMENTKKIAEKPPGKQQSGREGLILAGLCMEFFLPEKSKNRPKEACL
jgi:hypothetical protein